MFWNEACGFAVFVAIRLEFGVGILVYRELWRPVIYFGGLFSVSICCIVLFLCFVVPPRLKLRGAHRETTYRKADLGTIREQYNGRHEISDENWTGCILYREQ